jgi:hypothetical protein
MNEEQFPAEIDRSATYLHWSESGPIGQVSAWARDPDDMLKVRINDRWVFFKDLTPADEAFIEDNDGETD